MPTLQRHFLAPILVAILCAAGTSFAETTIVTPAEDSESVLVTRTEGGTAYPMYYVVEVDANAVKFEDAPYGLGEDGAAQTDQFVIEAEDGGSSIEVTTKAATNNASNTLSEGDSVLDNIGFRVTLVSIVDGVYTIDVTSEGAPHALSHVTFTVNPPEASPTQVAYD